MKLSDFNYLISTATVDKLSTSFIVNYGKAEKYSVRKWPNRVKCKELPGVKDKKINRVKLAC